MVRPVNLAEKEFTGFRNRLAAVVENPVFGRAIALIILVNAVTLGLQTDPAIMETHGDWLHALDVVILWVFVVELLAKLVLYGPSFFRQGWNVFDFLIVGIALVPASGPLSILRALRIFRILRLMSVIPSMRRVISALFSAIPGMASITGVLFILFYVAAVLATQVFGLHGTPEMEALFGTVGTSMFTLFQVMTLEGWAENVAVPTMEIFPWAWAFFVVFIIVTSFAVLNLFIGIIVDAMNMVKEEDLHEVGDLAQDDRAELKSDLQSEIQGLRSEIESLKLLLKDRV